MATTSAAARQLSDGNSQGTVMGKSTSDLISFYGVTAVAQPTVSANHAITSSVSVAPYGFATSTQAMLLINEVSTMAVALRTLGLVA